MLFATVNFGMSLSISLSLKFQDGPVKESAISDNPTSFNASFRAAAVALSGSFSWKNTISGLQIHNTYIEKSIVLISILIRVRMFLDSFGVYHPQNLNLIFMKLQISKPVFCKITVYNNKRPNSHLDHGTSDLDDHETFQHFIYRLMTQLLGFPM